MSNKASEEKVKIGGCLPVVGCPCSFLKHLTWADSDCNTSPNHAWVTRQRRHQLRAIGTDSGDVPPTQSSPGEVEHYLRYLRGY